MIHDDEDLAIYRRQLGIVERIVESWRQQLLPHNPKNFAIYAEGAIEQAEILRTEIDAYVASKNAKAPGTNSIQTPVGPDAREVS